MIGNPGIDSQVAQRVDAYQGNPQGLMQKYSKTQQLVDLLALQQLKTQKEDAAKQKMLQMAQAQGQPGTIAEQREKEVLDLTKGEIAPKVEGIAGVLQKAQQDKAAAIANAGQPGAGGPPGAATGLPTLPSNAALPAFAKGGIIAFQAGGTTPAGRWWEGVKSGLTGYIDKEELRANIAKIYGPKSAGAGLVMKQTDAERQEAKDIMSRLDDMSLDELKKLAERGGAPSAPPAPVSVPTEPTTALPVEPTAAPAASAVPVAAQPRPQPRPPAPVVQPPAPVVQPPAPPTGIAALPAAPPAAPDTLTPAVEDATKAAIAADPQKAFDAAQKATAAVTQRTPEERAKYDAMHQERQGFDTARFNPEKLRSDALTQWLLGAAGKSSFGGALAGAGANAEAYQRGQEGAQSEAIKGRYDMMDKYLGKDQSAREESVKSADIARQGANQARSSALSGGAQMAEGKARNAAQEKIHALDRNSVEKVAGMNNQAQEAIHALDRKAQADIHANHDRLQSEANAAVREGTATAKAGQLWAQASHYISQARADADKMFEKAAAPFRNAIAMARPGEKYEQETKAPKAELALLENRLNDQYKVIDGIYKPMIEQTTGRATGGNGLESLDTGGMKVVKKTP